MSLMSTFWTRKDDGGSRWIAKEGRGRKVDGRSVQLDDKDDDDDEDDEEEDDGGSQWRFSSPMNIITRRAEP